MKTSLGLTCLVFVVSAGLVGADERLEGIACRSVHLGYPAPSGTAFYNEVTVEASQVGTYFMACGWDKGYFGLQELANGKKLVIFSVWDSEQNDREKVDPERRVKLLHKDEKTRIGRFGGEGTGGQSFYDYDWKVGETYRFLVASRVDGERTEYAGYVFLPEEKRWVHMTTFSTITGGKPMKGYYSFVEDFRRNKVSATQERIARYGNGWVKGTDGAWTPLAKARFTADANPATNIDAGPRDDRFFLATGGAVENRGAKLRETIDRTAGKAAGPPADLPALSGE